MPNPLQKKQTPPTPFKKMVEIGKSSEVQMREFSNACYGLANSNEVSMKTKNYLIKMAEAALEFANTINRIPNDLD